MNAWFSLTEGYRYAMRIDNLGFTLKCLSLRRVEINPECFKIIKYYCHVLLFYYL